MCKGPAASSRGGTPAGTEVPRCRPGPRSSRPHGGRLPRPTRRSDERRGGRVAPTAPLHLDPARSPQQRDLAQRDRPVVREHNDRFPALHPPGCRRRRRRPRSRTRRGGGRRYPWCGTSSSSDSPASSRVRRGTCGMCPPAERDSRKAGRTHSPVRELREFVPSTLPSPTQGKQRPNGVRPCILLLR